MIKRKSKDKVYFYCSNYYRNKTCENNESISEKENKVKCIYIDKNKNVKIDIK